MEQAYPELLMAPTTQEKMPNPTFYEQEITGTEPAWCVDGRPADAEKGPQMLGGSLLPALLYCITNDLPLDEESLTQAFSQLEIAGYKQGVHRGSHAHEDKSDCGFADNLLLIILTAIKEQSEIKTRLAQVVDANPSIFPDAQVYKDLFNNKYLQLGEYTKTHENNLMSGEPLIGFCTEQGASATALIGEHAEVAAFVNLKPQTTLDVEKANQEGKPVFNLDLWAVVEQSQALNVDADTAQALSLILYVATEMVLVEQKGKPALPIMLHT